MNSGGWLRLNRSVGNLQLRANRLAIGVSGPQLATTALGMDGDAMGLLPLDKVGKTLGEMGDVTSIKEVAHDVRAAPVHGW